MAAAGVQLERGPAPRRTIRLRLTALYGSVFLASSVALLTVAYVLVRHTLHTRRVSAKELRRLHLPPDYEYGFAPRSHDARLFHTLSANIINQALSRLLVEYIIAIVVTTALAALIGWLVAGRALRPLREITATARRVSVENLGDRIDLRGPDDELKELARTFDGMLERLDAAFSSQRHFVANASHELRTPLAIMRTEIDVALGDPGVSVDDLRAMAETVRDSVDRCERLIASLLLLARSEASSGQPEAIDLAALAADCVTDMRASAVEAQVEVSAELASAWVDGDPGLLERLVANLLDNAIRHNVAGGWLSVRTGTDGERAYVHVANGGERIDPDEVASLAQPFRRLDRSVAGFGLGLSIVNTVAEAIGGTATLRARSGGGLEVLVRLPARALASDQAGGPGLAGEPVRLRSSSVS